MVVPIFSNRTARNGKLVPYLLLAVMAHAVALYLMKPLAHPPGLPQPMPPLEVLLLPLPQHQTTGMTVAAQPATTPQPSNTAPAIKASDAAEPPSRAVPQPTDAISISSTHAGELHTHPPTPPAAIPASPLSVQALLDSANRMGREDEHALPHTNTPALADRPVLAKLAAVMADKGKPAPGITQYADGRVKVVTAYGTVYCTQNIPDPAKTGPVTAENIPMTCP